MGHILVTGATGFIGQALVQSLAETHGVIAICRRDIDLPADIVRGNFDSFEDLRRLDRYEIDAVVHLAAVTGGCSERDGIMVNVEGTRCLMRYLMDRGCKKYVFASSSAVCGFQNPAFCPVALPIPDEHPCLDRDGYGVSKFLMEEVVKYHARQDPTLDCILLRLAAIFPDDQPPALVTPGPSYPWAVGSITLMAQSDAVRAFQLAAEAPYKPGVRIMNATSPKAWVAGDTMDVLRGWMPNLPADFTLPGNASVFDATRIREELGFEARVLPTVSV